MAFFPPLSAACEFRITLKTGCLILGWVPWVITVINLFGMITFLSSDLSIAYDTETGFGMVALNILSQIPEIMLLIGTYKEKACLLLPWMILVGIAAVFCVLSLAMMALGDVVALLVAVATLNGNLMLMGIVGLLVTALYGLYTWFVLHCFRVVESYYTILKDNNEGGAQRIGVVDNNFRQMV